MADEQPKHIGLQLVEEKLINEEQLKTAVEYRKSLGGSLTAIVVKLGFVTDQDLTRFLARQSGVQELEDLGAMVLPVALVKKVPLSLIKKYQIIPVHQTGKTLTIATADPTDFNAVEELQFATGMRIELNLAPRADIIKAITEFEDTVKGSKRLDPGPLAGSPGTEDGIVDDLRGRGDGKLTSRNLTKGELREAAIPLLIKKGVISRAELYDAVLELLLKKGVIDAREVQSMRQG